MVGDRTCISEERRIFPLACCSFGFVNWGDHHTSWDYYEYQRSRIQYTAIPGAAILNCQAMNHPAAQHRRALYKRCAELLLPVDFSFSSPAQLHEKINSCLCALFAPGADISGMDRIVGQFLAFGCCVICPPITQAHPHAMLEAGVHYLPCRLDFADVEEKLNTPQETMRRIGLAAKHYFRQHLTPVPLVRAILERVRDVAPGI